MKLVFLAIGLILTPCSGVFSAVSIEGKAEFYAGKTIAFSVYEDLFTETTKEISRTKIGSDGSFKLEAEISEIRPVVLTVGFFDFKLFVTPESHYSVTLPKIPYELSFSFQKQQLNTIGFDNLARADINSLIADFNYKIEQWLGNNIEAFSAQRHYKKLKDFSVKLDSIYAPIDFPYFKAFREYALASYIGYSASRKTIFEEFIEQNPIQFQNPEYINFFRDFYDKTLYNSSFGLDKKNIAYHINISKSPELIKHELQKNDFLNNDQLCELVMIMGLTGIYSHSEFKKESVRIVLDSLKKSSIYEANKIIAANYYSLITKNEQGFPAPVFSLKNIANGSMVGLEQFRGKYVYLNFFTCHSKSSINEMNLIPELKKEYGNNIEFISISLDENEQTVKNFLGNSPDYNWTFLYGGIDTNLAKTYAVKTLPAFFIIDTWGNFYTSNSPEPSRGIRKIFHKIAYQNRKEKSPLFDR